MCVGEFIWRFTIPTCVLGSLYEYLYKLDIIRKLQWSRFQICRQPRSTPGSLRLYGLLKDWPCGMTEKPQSRYSNWKPSQPEASSMYSYLSNSPTVASLLVGNLQFPSVPGHIDLGTRLARLGTKNMQLFPFKCSAYNIVTCAFQPPLAASCTDKFTIDELTKFIAN